MSPRPTLMKNKGGPWFRFRPQVFSRVFPDPEPEWRKYAIFGFRPAQRSVSPCFLKERIDGLPMRDRRKKARPLFLDHALILDVLAGLALFLFVAIVFWVLSLTGSGSA